MCFTALSFHPTILGAQIPSLHPLLHLIILFDLMDILYGWVPPQFHLVICTLTFPSMIPLRMV